VAGRWSCLCGRPATTCRPVHDAVAWCRTGDAPRSSLVRRAGRLLGWRRVRTPFSLLQTPGVVVIGGQLVAPPEQLMAGIREMVTALPCRLATAKLHIVPSALGPRAGLIGTALLLAAQVSPPPDRRQRSPLGFVAFRDHPVRPVAAFGIPRNDKPKSFSPDTDPQFLMISETGVAYWR